jgi:hypothetical protein
VLTVTATVLGLCFGLGAPSVSPVAPSLSAITSAAVVDQAAAPADPAVAADPAAPAGPDRRDGQLGRGDAFGQQGRRQ